MLRVSSNTSFTIGAQNINARQADMLTVQTQLSSGLRINAPSDDPVGASQVASLNSALGQLGQYQNNQSAAISVLNQGESTLQQFNDAMQSARQDLVAAGNGTYSDAERTSLATDLQGIMSRMIGLANTTDATGQYLFAGSKSGAAPFVQSGNQVGYRGDATPQSVEVAPGRLLQTRLPGDSVFAKIAGGNGTFATSATSTNTGSGIIEPGSVSDPSKLTGDNYTISFSGSGSALTYSIQNTTLNTTVATGNYGDPTTLQFDGMAIKVSGAPAAGDTFKVAPAGTQSIFTTMAQAIANLQTPASTPAASARFTTAREGQLAAIDQAMTHISLQQSTIGTQLNELDAYQSLNSQDTLDSKTQLSHVQDLDYAQAASQLAQKQMSYQAALQSYTMISKLSLFQYL